MKDPGFYLLSPMLSPIFIFFSELVDFSYDSHFFFGCPDECDISSGYPGKSYMVLSL